MMTLTLTAMFAFNQDVMASKLPEPPPTQHEQHMQQHLQLHNEAHRNAIETTNRHHEEAIRKHQAFESQMQLDAESRRTRSMIDSYAAFRSQKEMPRRFSVGDMYYASSFKGLKIFMNDVEHENPLLYETLKPEYNQLQRKRNAAIATWSTGAAVGSTLILGGFTFWNNNDRMLNTDDSFQGSNPKKPNVGMIASGAGIFLASSIIGMFLQPKEEDIYNFVNHHNRNSPTHKLKWEIGLDMFHDFEPGVKLTLRF